MPRIRPPVTIVVPFHGSAAEARDVVRMLGSLDLRPDDEAIVVDNTPGHVALDEPRADRIQVVESPVEGSAYAARNVGAERARNAWLLFCDADCTPPADLLDRYLAQELDARCGALAGDVLGDPSQTGLIPRYVRSRRHLDQVAALGHPYKPMAVTANLLVRRAAWEEVGGFQEGTRSGADAEFCWRLQEAGWALEHRPGAEMIHSHRDTLAALLRQSARDGAGGAWLENRRPGSAARPRLVREMARAAAGIVAWTITGRIERAAFKALDGVWVAAWNAGYLTNNDAHDARREGAAAIAVVATFPAAAHTGLVPALAQRGARVEATSRPEHPYWSEGRALAASFSEDEGPGRRTLDWLWLLAHHPLRCLSDRARPARNEPLRAIAPAVRRAIAGRATQVLAGPEPEDATRAVRIVRLAGLEHEGPVADPATHHGHDLDEIVQDQVRGE